MDQLEVFVHRGCLSEQPALKLAHEIQKEFPAWRVWVVDNRDRARALGVVTFPAFVLNGKVLTVGVPQKEWLMRAILERTRHEMESSSSGSPSS